MNPDISSQIWTHVLTVQKPHSQNLNSDRGTFIRNREAVDNSAGCRYRGASHPLINIAIFLLHCCKNHVQQSVQMQINYGVFMGCTLVVELKH